MMRQGDGNSDSETEEGEQLQQRLADQIRSCLGDTWQLKDRGEGKEKSFSFPQGFVDCYFFRGTVGIIISGPNPKSQ